MGPFHVYVHAIRIACMSAALCVSFVREYLLHDNTEHAPFTQLCEQPEQQSRCRTSTHCMAAPASVAPQHTSHCNAVLPTTSRAGAPFTKGLCVAGIVAIAVLGCECNIPNFGLWWLHEVLLGHE
jgi:hypothetical protein